MTSRGAPGRSPMWLSHHHPSEHDRCVVVGGVPVCRRCLLLYPLAFLTLSLAAAGARWPRSLDPVLLVVLPLPAVAEFVLEHLRRIPYRPAWQAVVTVPLAAALGVGFDRYLHHHGDALWWGTVAVYGGVCFAAALVAARR
jgi:hypothetical protein